MTISAASEPRDLEMDGCVPKEMLSYLKALGVLKAIAERADGDARGFWRDGDQWVVRSGLDKDGALDFFMNEYRPAPVMSPWNKDSGFYPSKSGKMPETPLDRIIIEESPRFDDWRKVAHASRRAAEEANRKFDKGDKDRKIWILRRCRNRFPDAALEWIDAAFVLTDEDSARFPPLFGSGGNDGRLEMGRKYSACVEQCLLPENRAKSAELLESALFASKSPSIKNKAVGTVGAFDVEASDQNLINPWDFVLAMEGALLFAGSASRRLGASAQPYAAYPFMVAVSSPAGSQTVSADESGSKSKGEIWTPVWESPASFREVKSLMSEGRAEIGKKQAENSVDFARAISGLGVARGVRAFDRYGFLERNGQSRIVAWLDRVEVPPSPPSGANALGGLDRLRRNIEAASSDKNSPASLNALRDKLEDSMYRFAKGGGNAAGLQDILLQTAEVERYAGKIRNGKLPPISQLQRIWEREADDGSAEFRLALSLASIFGDGDGSLSIRENLEPVKVDPKTRKTEWSDAPRGAFVWSTLRNPLLNMAAVLERRCMDSRRRDFAHPALDGRRRARIEDVIDFMEGRVGARRVGDLALALSMIKMGAAPPKPRNEGRRRPILVPPAYAAMKLTLLPRDLQTNGALVSIGEPTHIRTDAALIPLLRAGRVGDAYELAKRRLKASARLSVKSANPEIADGTKNGLRLAAALLFPISERADAILADAALRPNKIAAIDEDEN